MMSHQLGLPEWRTGHVLRVYTTAASAPAIGEYRFTAQTGRKKGEPMLESIERVLCDNCPATGPEVRECESAREAARLEGWLCNEDGDLCPRCIALEKWRDGERSDGVNSRA